MKKSIRKKLAVLSTGLIGGAVTVAAVAQSCFTGTNENGNINEIVNDLNFFLTASVLDMNSDQNNFANAFRNDIQTIARGTNDPDSNIPFLLIAVSFTELSSRTILGNITDGSFDSYTVTLQNFGFSTLIGTANQNLDPENFSSADVISWGASENTPTNQTSNGPLSFTVNIDANLRPVYIANSISSSNVTAISNSDQVTFGTTQVNNLVNAPTATNPPIVETALLTAAREFSNATIAPDSALEIVSVTNPQSTSTGNGTVITVPAGNLIVMLNVPNTNITLTLNNPAALLINVIYAGFIVDRATINPTQFAVST